MIIMIIMIYMTNEHHAVQGGMGGVSNSIAKSALAAGAELYTSRCWRNLRHCHLDGDHDRHHAHLSSSSPSYSP